MERRDALKLMALMAAAPTFSFACAPGEEAGSEGASMSAPDGTTRPGPDYTKQFFTDHEMRTVRVMADMVIPADDRSGSATDARVPEFIDHVMTDELLGDPEPRQTAMRGGLAWVDYQCLERFDTLFADCTEAQRTELLDDIAWPDAAPEGMTPGVEFFTSFRNLVASGFFSSKMGVEDLGYVGNTYVSEWTGCPDDVLSHIGVQQA
jgi:hypothetical protein